MKVDAVNGLNHRVNCTFCKQNKKRDNVRVDNPIDVNSLAKVPVIVLLAMNPATLNSAIPMMPETDNPDKIVMLAPETKSADAATYVISPETEELQQTDPPYGWLSLKRYKIQNEVHGKSPMFEYDMLFATSTLANGDYNKITDVFIIRNGQNPSNNPYTPPPKVEKLYYHNTEDGKEYYGAYIADPISDSAGNEKSFKRHEIRIDDNTTKQIINLIKGNTKWDNATKIRFFETKSPQRQETIIY